jgi:hypothetical protein
MLAFSPRSRARKERARPSVNRREKVRKRLLSVDPHRIGLKLRIH